VYCCFQSDLLLCIVVIIKVIFIIMEQRYVLVLSFVTEAGFPLTWKTAGILC